MRNYITEQSAGDIISNSFRIYRENFWTLLLIVAIPTCPFLILSSIALAIRDQYLLTTTLILLYLMLYFANGPITVATSEICLGQKPTVARSYQRTWNMIGSYLLVYVLYVLVVFVGLLLLIIPGIVMGVILMFSLPAAILERLRGVSALKRSVRLGRGSYVRNWLIYLGILIFWQIIVIILAIVFAVIFGLLGASFGVNPALPAHILSYALAIVAAPLYLIPIVLLYYDMRVRKEHFDSDALAQELIE